MLMPRPDKPVDPIHTIGGRRVRQLDSQNRDLSRSNAYLPLGTMQNYHALLKIKTSYILTVVPLPSVCAFENWYTRPKTPGPLS